jgi:hypothetical protein
MDISNLARLPDRAPLWKVFWLQGVIPSNLLWGVVLWMIIRGMSPWGVRALLLLVLAYTAWIVLAVWQAAPNTANPRYGVLARALTVAWAINTVLLVFFLELQSLS